MALPVTVSDAVALYGADAVAASGLVIAAGAVIWAGFMLHDFLQSLFSPGASSSSDGYVSSVVHQSGDRQPDFPDLYEVFEMSAKEDRKALEFNAAAEDFGGVDGLRSHMDQVEASYEAMWAEQEAQLKANTAEYDRLADVWQGWTDQVEKARAAGGVAPAASQSLALYDSLVQRGMDAQDAIAAVEARNAAVQRAEAREAQEYESTTGRSYY